jgi:hypothetical protein
MEKAFDITSVRRTLRDGIAKGYWTLEQLDQPSMGWAENAKSFRLHHPLYVQHEYRNPLRDVPSEPSVEVISPRDFAPQEPPSTEYPF